jgi:ABC-type Fe3+-siderophore transport system permease subunit
MSWLGFVFYILFAVVQVGIYLGIRREWLPAGKMIGIGVGASVVLAMAIAFASGNALVQALFVALLLGGLISGAIVVTALYFHNQRA